MRRETRENLIIAYGMLSAIAAGVENPKPVLTARDVIAGALEREAVDEDITRADVEYGSDAEDSGHEAPAE